MSRPENKENIMSLADQLVWGMQEYAGGSGDLPLTIDVDDTEALLIRKDGDAGDVLIVDTASPQVSVNVNADFVLGSTDAEYWGATGTDTTWKIVRDGTKLSIQRRESGAYVEKGYFDVESFHADNIFVGTVKLEDEEGCIAANEYHAHGRDGVSGYLKIQQGTTPSAHKEASHLILWVDSADKLRFEMPDGTDYTVIVADENGLVGIGVTPDDWLHIKGNNAAVKLEDDGGNIGQIRAGDSQLTIEVDPDNEVSSTDMVFKMDGEEVARFLVGGQFRSLESINAKEGFATRLWDIAGADWDTTPGVNTEYYSPNQHGGIYGTVYRQYFTTTLPASLTSGNNVARLVDYNVMFKYTTANRGVSHGMSVTYTASEYRILIILSGASGSGNISWDNDTYTPIEGWVDYCK